MPTLSIQECLKLFNRKERYWVILQALSNGEGLHLHQEFLDAVLEKAGIATKKKACDVWWAMDYHFNWIAGALKLYQDGYTTGEVLENNLQETAQPCNPPSLATESQEEASSAILITKSQEDTDLIISFEKYIILIEAKGVTPWITKQVDSKLERINHLRQYMDQLGCHDIKILFFLMSPTESAKLSAHIKNTPLAKIPHLTLKINNNLSSAAKSICGKKEFLETTRCNAQGHHDKSTYKHWTIQPVWERPKS